MVDWTVVASLATAVGTLALAASTFVAVRSANRSARLTEYAMQVGIRPLLVPSRLEDATQKIMWVDEHRVALPGAGATCEVVDGNIYLAMSLRNAAQGIAVIHGWHLRLDPLGSDHPHAEQEEFRPQLRDLYVPGDGVAFWQAAIRDEDDPEYTPLADTIGAGRVFAVELLYSDDEGGQRSIGMYAVSCLGEERWMASMVRHWNLDRPDPNR
jgi:hypothetical protein